VASHMEPGESSHVLVTGGLGFIGSFLTEALVVRGDRVTVVDSCVSSLIEPEDLVAPPGSVDVVTAGVEARPIPQSLDKFLPQNVWTYEIPKIIWSDAPSKPAVYVDSSETIADKIDGLTLYATQLREPPHIRSPENVRALAYLRGSEIGVEYAEAFTVLRSVLR
jgi:nucleoside-diphosphate-sugar epimerase